MHNRQSLLTVGEIARRLEQEVHRIEYIVRSRKIQPANWAGHARVFREADLSRIASELRRIDGDRNAVSPQLEEQLTDGK
jgi:hypothetical protein